MLCLSEEVLQFLVDRWLSTADVLALSAVCRQLRDTVRGAKIDVFLDARRVRGDNLSELQTRFREFAQAWPNVSSVTMQVAYGDNKYERHKINLSRCPDGALHDIVGVLPFLRQLRTLELDGVRTSYSNFGDHADYTSLLIRAHAPTLREITLFGCSVDWKQCGLALASCSNLQTACFSSSSIDHTLICSLVQCTSLTQLGFVGGSGGPSCFLALAKLPRLQILRTSLCGGVDKFSPSDAAKFRTLREARITLAGWEDRLYIWAACPQLTCLHVTQDQLSQEGLRAVAANSTLVGLNMAGFSELTEKVDFSELQGAHLRRLALRESGSNMTTQKIVNLAAACVHLTHLVLDLTMTNDRSDTIFTEACGLALAGLSQLRVLTLTLDRCRDMLCLQGLRHSQSLVALKVSTRQDTSRAIDLHSMFMLPGWTALQCVLVTEGAFSNTRNRDLMSYAVQVLTLEYQRAVHFCKQCRRTDKITQHEPPAWTGLFDFFGDPFGGED